jgi:hypothetical protein
MRDGSSRSGAWGTTWPWPCCKRRYYFLKWGGRPRSGREPAPWWRYSSPRAFTARPSPPCGSSRRRPKAKRRRPKRPAASWPSCTEPVTTRAFGLLYEPKWQRPSGSAPQPASPCAWGAGAGTHRPLGSAPQPALVIGAVCQIESSKVRSEPSTLEGATRDEATARAKRALRMEWTSGADRREASLARGSARFHILGAAGSSMG